MTKESAQEIVQKSAQGVVVLGATGSIGTSALDVIGRHPDRFRVAVLTAHSRVGALIELARRHRPRQVVIGDPRLEAKLREGLQGLRSRHGPPIEARSGPRALAEAAAAEDVQVVIAAIVGAAGLVPTFAAARAGKRVLLANKEAVVCAGSLLVDAVRCSGGELLPVDSEHNAIHQCLAGARDSGCDWRRDVRRLILTASGGPFRARADLSDVKPAEAIAHPNWVMGPKISVDSATLMNKGLEVIEASCLFGFAPEQIDTVLHPQSVIHSLVEFNDGSLIAQLGTPDMRTPLAYCLGFPERIEGGSARLDLLQLAALTFEAPDPQRFPCLPLAYHALRSGAGATAVLNAANEIAVEAFLHERLAFAAIARVIEQTLSAMAVSVPTDIDEVLAIDAQAREIARAQIERLTSALV